VTRLTDSAGGTASTYRYDAFGATRAQTGSGNTYGFTSRESETGAGLYYNRARFYEPGNGRFLSADPTGFDGGLNRFAYVGANPVNRVDPAGTDPVPSWSPPSSPPGATLTWQQRCLLSGGCDTRTITGGSRDGQSSGRSGTYTSAYCDGWAVARGLCIPSNNAPDASLAFASGSVSAATGTCTNWGAVAFGVGLIAFLAVVAVAVTIVAPEIWLEPHWDIFIGELFIVGGLGIAYGMNQQCS